MGRPDPMLVIDDKPVPVAVNTGANARIAQMGMVHRQVIMAVLDEFGGTAGIITLEDIIEEDLWDGRTPLWYSS